MKCLILKLLKEKNLTPDIIAGFKRSWAKKTGLFPRHSEILAEYKRLTKSGQVRTNKFFEKALRLKKVRSLSGIVPIAVMTKPYPCPGKCVYCPTQAQMPKSYLTDEPAVMRAQRVAFDPYLQVQDRLRQFEEIGHHAEKIELIVMGGTFSVLPKNYQLEFIINCFSAANQQKKQTIKTLEQLEQLEHFNETAKHRIIGLTLETRPDQITPQEIKWMLKLGATRVEIGVQSIYDPILKKVNRGHKVAATIKATQLLKEAGFKICYHLMPNLPGSNPKKDLQMFKTIFSDSRFMPDMIKIYPCVVCYQAELYNWFKKGKFKPYTDKDLIELLIKIKQIMPQWVRINRLGRDIPIANISAGNKISNIRQVLQSQMKNRGLKCQCIRCREIRNLSRHPEFSSGSMKIIHYPASQGMEYFLQYVDKQNRLYALLRLRLGKIAIIRELHTYGESLPIKITIKTNKTLKQLAQSKTVQHKGLGKKLIQKAEQIALQKGFKKLWIISGVGVREYYRRLGYKLKNTYMVKNL